jgi:hypothetical protein
VQDQLYSPLDSSHNEIAPIFEVMASQYPPWIFPSRGQTRCSAVRQCLNPEEGERTRLEHRLYIMVHRSENRKEHPDVPRLALYRFWVRSIWIPLRDVEFGQSLSEMHKAGKEGSWLSTLIILASMAVVTLLATGLCYESLPRVRSTPF